MQVKSIKVIQGNGPDTVLLTFDLPSPIPAMGERNLTVKFAAPPGEGLEYVRKNFPGIALSIY